MHDLNSLNAVSPVDGRYRNQTLVLSDFFSEQALIRYRLQVEVEYFLALCEIPLPELAGINATSAEKFRDLYRKFNAADADRVKELEKETNHDVKALEYFIKEKMHLLGWDDYKEFIHFGLTSQDINNTAMPMAVRDAVYSVYIPMLEEILTSLNELSEKWNDIPMLSRTHGQPASPTRLGKEVGVFVERISSQLELMKKIPFSAKFGGATGNFNAHHVAYPSVDWKKFADDFVEDRLDLVRQQLTTQIEHYDHLCALFDNIKRINNILIDLNRDFWTYISMDYFSQSIQGNEVGSSAMPHKVNPIDFENSEGNLGMANAIFEHLSAKLPISRLQRDLTDSTVIRNAGVPFAHTVIALRSLRRGLGKISVNRQAIDDDLSSNWAVVAEAIQTILRKEKYPKPYEALKSLTRTNSKITKESIHSFIDGLNLDSGLKTRLKEITPFNYTGL
ncbi:MAG: adenylosuccinate lyase [Bacteroidetes bacterium]|nr:MAG: adenylosuccinate lyase [Bacteroidota bacterium]REK06652.1 MAG: adenylosuccinate lyase [Bacteroidota bacterium]REK33418.1 MAG: adenylosuccinate lyase [Bacteroidota bacterium]REK49817.1 MAG: adenylosuccinate lyase [Bacteroidota bacterium]